MFYTIKDAGKNRRPKLHLSSFGNNYVCIMNPFMPMWWSLAMPGAGHIMLGKISKGFLLFIWEMLINNKAHINLSIFYSCTGQFQLAKECLDIRWFFLYIGVYVFNTWDAYRLTTDINQFSMLAVRNKSPIQAFNLSLVEINYLQKTDVRIPVFWSLITPGLGQLIVRNIAQGTYLIIWYIITAYQSNLATGLYYTAMGNFQQAIEAVDIQWFLFIPSIYSFAICDSYYRSIELNELFKREQARFLQQNYYRATDKHIFLDEL